jgi:hypothetical protein
MKAVLGAFGQLLDGAGGGHVLGQVEVVAAGLARLRGHGHRQVVGQRVDHGVPDQHSP